MNWTTSTYSGANGCVQVAADGTTIPIRDSKNPDGGTLHIATINWRQFVAAVKNGEIRP